MNGLPLDLFLLTFQLIMPPHWPSKQIVELSLAVDRVM